MSEQQLARVERETFKPILKRIPARTETLTALWCKKDFMVMNQAYRDIRATTKKPMDACFLCSHKLADGEMIALACFQEKGNRILCQTCATKLMESKLQIDGV